MFPKMLRTVKNLINIINRGEDKFLPHAPNFIVPANWRTTGRAKLEKIMPTVMKIES